MKNLPIFLLSLVILAGAFYLISERQVLAGSVGAGYSYKNITVANASSTAGTVVKGGFGELGTLTINSATATSPVIIYDGATTATSGLSVIAKIGATQAGGSYTYEVAVTKGVVVEVPSTFTGDLTFSVR